MSASNAATNAKLDGIIREVAKLERADLVARVRKNLMVAAMGQVKLGFRQSVDPYDKPWAPLKRNRTRNKKKRGKALVLRDTGRLANSFSANALSNGFEIGSNVAYGPFHQMGTSKIPQRMMLPDGNRLGARWDNVLSQAAARTVARYFAKFR